MDAESIKSVTVVGIKLVCLATGFLIVTLNKIKIAKEAAE